jgi:hypothetical protein
MSNVRLTLKSLGGSAQADIAGEIYTAADAGVLSLR